MRHHHLTQATPILDHHAPAIRQLIQQRNWTSLGLHDRVGAAYAFVRDEIAFGYNTQDDLPASRVLADGIGQCNTKGTLLMALLRAMDVPWARIGLIGWAASPSSSSPGRHQRRARPTRSGCRSGRNGDVLVGSPYGPPFLFDAIVITHNIVNVGGDA